MNHAAYIHDKDYHNHDSGFMFSRNGFKNSTNKRYFTVQCIAHSEVLQLAYTDLDRMKLTFSYAAGSFFKRMIKQTYEILQYHVNVIQSGLEGGKVTRFRSPSKKMRVNEANKESESLQ